MLAGNARRHRLEPLPQILRQRGPGIEDEAQAREERTREGVVVSPSVWWKKLTPDGGNANNVTGQALTDLGRAATFYDCLVQVERV